MIDGEAGTAHTITSLAPASDVARAFARCLPALRAQMRMLRWVSLGIFAVVGLLPPATVGRSLVLLAGAVFILWLTSTDGLARYYVSVVRKTPSLTLPQAVTPQPDGLHFLDHESDRRYRWHRWEAVADLPEGIALVLRGGWQADLLHASAFATPEVRADWLREIRHGIDRPPAPSA